MQNEIEYESEASARFESLFQLHHGEVFRYCIRRLGSPDAEDATAEVFVVVWRRLRQAPLDNSRAWLLSIAHRVVANQYRSRRRRQGLFTRLLGATGPKPEAPPEFENLHKALEELRATDRELLRLSSWDHLSRAEIAQVLGINENAVDQRMHRARSRLKERLDVLNLDSPITKKAPA